METLLFGGIWVSLFLGFVSFFGGLFSVRLLQVLLFFVLWCLVGGLLLGVFFFWLLVGFWFVLFVLAPVLVSSSVLVLLCWGACPASCSSLAFA